MDTLAKRLIWAREKKGMTQSQLADAAKVSQSTIGNLEAGIRQTSRKVAVIADVLGIDALWLSEGGTRSPEGKAIERRNVEPKKEVEGEPAHKIALERFQRIAAIYWQLPDSGQMSILRMAENVRKSAKTNATDEQQEARGKQV